jgi:hypothetical protein
MSAGGSLTVNPHTGLPEAGFLKSLLPMIAGGLATFFSGGTLLAPILAGAGTGALTGDKKQSLLMRAGLGALGGWGGGGIASALAGAGAATGTAAAGQIAKAGTDAAAKAAAEQGATQATKLAAQKAAEEAMRKQLIEQGVKGMAGKGLMANLSSAGSGLSGMFQPGGTALAGSTLSQLGLPKAFAAATPITTAAPKSIKGSKEVPPEYQMYSYNPGKQNPNFGKPGHEGEPPILGQSYSAPRITNQNPFSPSYSSYDKKGKPIGPAMLSPLEQYMRDMQAQQQQPTIAAADGGSLNDYINNVNANNAKSAPVQPYKPPHIPAQNFVGNNFERSHEAYTGALAPLINRVLGMNGFSGSGYGNPAPKYDAANHKFGYADGGGINSLGHYSDGGRLLRGPGDGVSDDIPAMIHRNNGTKQEARLADGEFVFPARIVSEIGNGSTEAGAQKLYAVMDKIQKDRARTIKDVALDTHADRHLQALV